MPACTLAFLKIASRQSYLSTSEPSSAEDLYESSFLGFYAPEKVSKGEGTLWQIPGEDVGLSTDNGLRPWGASQLAWHSVPYVGSPCYSDSLPRGAGCASCVRLF